MIMLELGLGELLGAGHHLAVAVFASSIAE
jgi:hypothetical protein